MNVSTNTYDANTIHTIASEVVPPIVTVTDGEEYQLTSADNKGIITALIETNDGECTIYLPPCAPGLIFTLVLSPQVVKGNCAILVNVVDVGLSKFRYIGLKTVSGVVTGDTPGIGNGVTLTDITPYGGVFTITADSNKVWVMSGCWDKVP